MPIGAGCYYFGLFFSFAMDFVKKLVVCFKLACNEFFAFYPEDWHHFNVFRFLQHLCLGGQAMLSCL